MKRTSILIVLCLLQTAVSLLHAGAREGACGPLGGRDTAVVRSAATVGDTLRAHGSIESVEGDTLRTGRGDESSSMRDLGISSAPQIGISGQSRPQASDSMFWFIKRKPLALGATLAFSIPIVLLEYQWWWRDDYLYKQHSFIYKNDGGFNNYSLGVDKCGHFFTSYVYFHTFYDLMKWADYSETTALWVGIAVPAAHAISIELMDGYAKYGFSSYDLTANFLGMGYAYAQIKHPYLNNFNIKWSYWPTSGGNAPSSSHGFAEDYTGHTYWVSVNMKGVLPEAVAGYWPKYLNLAVGYGASNVSHNENIALAKHKFAIALDYNLSGIEIANDTWSMLVRFADKFHYPAPGIKVYTGGEVNAKPLLLY